MATIVLADPESSRTAALQDLLLRRQHQVKIVSGSPDLLREVRLQPPDLIVLTTALVEPDGIAACRQLRADRATATAPILLILESESATARVEAALAGASDIITWAADPQDMVDHIESLIDSASEQTVPASPLLESMLQTTLTVLPCGLAWVFTLSEAGDTLDSRAAAAAGGPDAGARFLQKISHSSGLSFPVPVVSAGLDRDGALKNANLLVRSVLTGIPEINVSLADLRAQAEEILLQACELLNLYFISLMPLHLSGRPLGVLVLGMFEPRDIQTPRDQLQLASVVGQIAMAVDYTRMARHVATLDAESQQERAFLDAVLTAVRDAVLLIDPEGMIRYASPQMASISGYACEALKGTSIADLLTHAGREALGRLLSDATDTQEIEIDLVAAGGQLVPTAVTIYHAVLPDSSGSQVRLLTLTELSGLKALDGRVERQARLLSALNRATQAINSSLTLDEALNIILDEATTALDAEIASVLLRPPGANTLFYHSVVGSHADRLRGHRVPVDNSIAGFVVQHGRPALISDAYSDTRVFPEIDALTGLKARSIASVPVLVQDEPVGVVQVVSEQVGRFDSDDLETLQSLARSAAVAIENASLFGETQRQVRELTLLLQASEAASSTLAIETVLQIVARQLIDALRVTWCVISSWDHSSDSLVKLAEVAEMAWPTSQQTIIPLDSFPLTRRVLETGEPAATSIDAPDVEQLRRQALLGEHFWSVLLAPLVVKGRSVGLVELYHASSQLLFGEADFDRCRLVVTGWHSSLARGREWDAVESLNTLSVQLLQATGTAWCKVLSYDPQADQVAVIYERGEAVWTASQGESQPLDDLSLRRVALMERTAVAASLSDQRLSPADRAALPRLDRGAILVAPLVAHGEAIGLVHLIDTDAHREFSEIDLSLAQAIANVVGNALENGRLYSALARRAAQLEAAYNDLRDADRTTDEMIQNISHELRTPLAPVIGYTDMLLAEDLGPLTEEQRSVLETIATQGRLLTRMVGDILTVQSVAEEDLQRAPVQLSDVARTAMESMALAARKHNISVVLECPPDLPSILADEQRILQVFENLLSNAIKFSPAGGLVSITIKDIGHSLQTEIRDQGIGIPPEEHDKIWRRFYQVDGSTTRAYNGLGLGLTIVKQVVEKHEGHVEVFSQRGQGSVFTFTLPRIEPTSSYTPG